jgi:hypothetical protein
LKSLAVQIQQRPTGTMKTPLTYAIDPWSGIGTITYHTMPTTDEWRSSLEAMLADGAWRAGYGIVFDRKNMPQVASTEYIRFVVDFFERHPAELKGSRMAVVFGNADAAYGMGRMAEGMIEGKSYELRAFHDMDAAMYWVRTGR